MSFFSLHSWKAKIFFGTAIGTVAWALVLVFYQADLLEPFELKTYDHLCRTFAARTPAPKEIVLVGVDQGSVEAAQQQGINWPWPRQMYAPIVHFCASAGAQAIAFDILYTEPSAYGVEDDEVLSEALKETRGVLLPFFLSSTDRVQTEWEAEFLGRTSLSVETPAGEYLSPYSSVIVPIRTLAKAAAGLGNVEIPPDSDGIYRRLPLIFPYRENWLPSLGLSVVLYLNGGESMAYGGNYLRLGQVSIPLDKEGKFLLSFYGNGREYPRYSAFNVIQSYLALQEGAKPIYQPSVFKDKIVFVGYTAAGLFDLKPTPVTSVYPGMAVHATLVANLLNQHFRVRISPFAILAVSAGVALLTGVTVMLLVNIWQLALLTLAYAAGLLLFVMISFWHNLWVDGILLVLSLGLAFALTAAFSYATEGRQRRLIKSMFSHYMSDLLIQDLLKNPNKLRLGGEKRVLTVFFSDLAGFTTLSERLTPEEVVALLNRYLTAMTDIILASGGLIDKYEGDAIMAFWGAPVPQDDHAARACLAALDNQSRLAELRQEFASMGLPPVHSRIGINTGDMIIGNMGSSQRFDFTVMGDSVNLASRLEGASKAYSTSIIISEETYRQAANQVEARELDLLRVKGKELPVRIYELLARKGALNEPKAQVCHLFAEGLAQYRKQNWTEAIGFFRQALAMDPEDGPSKTFIERAQDYMRTPPPPSWDGIYRLTIK